MPYTVGSFLTITAPRGSALRKEVFLAQQAQQLQQQGLARGSGSAAALLSTDSGSAAADVASATEAGDQEPPSSAYAAPPPAGLDARLGYCKELQCWAVSGAACEAPLVRQTQVCA